MKSQPPDTPLGPRHNSFFVQGPARAELEVRCHFTELLLQSREIENQTRVRYLDRQVPLWEALKSVTETCFSLWSQIDDSRRDAFIREALAVKERCAGEGQALVLAALKNPLQPKAVARAMLLGHNFLRTLDICLEGLLRYPSQKSVARKPLRTEVTIDWAVGGIRDWAVHYPYAFEKTGRGKRAPQRMAHAARHYSTDRSVRSQISHKQIANVFMLKDTTVSEIEHRALAALRASFKDAASGNFDLAGLADV